jgi:hypothetical protein
MCKQNQVQKQCKLSAGVTFPVTDNFLSFVLTWYFSDFHSIYLQLFVPDICYANMTTLEETHGLIPITLSRRLTRIVSKSKVKFLSLRRLDMHVR